MVFTFIFAGFGASVLLAKPLTADEKGKRKKEVVATLSGTTWEVELFSMDDPKKKPIKDVVSYEHGRLKSKHFESEGYPDSNLTVTIEDDGKAIWETMQSNPDMGPVFWRGELAEKTVTGVVSRTDKAGKTEAFSLRGLQTGTFVVTPEKPPVIIEAPKEIPAAVVPAAAATDAAVENAGPKAFDALFGKPKAPVAMPTDAAKAATPAVKPAAPAVSATALKPAAASSVPANKPVVPAMKKPEPVVSKTVAAVKAEVKPVVAAPASVKPAAVTAQVQTQAADAMDDKKKDKEKWFW